jgi:ferredoxin-NADP reductase
MVNKRVKESENVTSFYLKPAEGDNKLPEYQPGQYTAVSCILDESGRRQARQYVPPHCHCAVPTMTDTRCQIVRTGENSGLVSRGKMIHAVTVGALLEWRRTKNPKQVCKRLQVISQDYRDKRLNEADWSSG